MDKELEEIRKVFRDAAISEARDGEKPRNMVDAIYALADSVEQASQRIARAIDDHGRRCGDHRIDGDL